MRYKDAVRRWGTPAEERITGNRRRAVFKSGYCHKTLVFRLPDDVLIDAKDTRPDGSKLGKTLEERLTCIGSLRP